MHQVDNETTTPERPAFEKTIRPGWFSKGGHGQAATYPGADWFNMVQAELLSVLVSADILPDKAQIDQLAQAIVKLATDAGQGAVTGVYLEKAKNLKDVPSKPDAREALNVHSKTEVNEALASLAESLRQALQQVATELQHHQETQNAHAATHISAKPSETLQGENVQAQLNELAAAVSSIQPGIQLAMVWSGAEALVVNDWGPGTYMIRIRGRQYNAAGFDYYTLWLSVQETTPASHYQEHAGAPSIHNYEGNYFVSYYGWHYHDSSLRNRFRAYQHRTSGSPVITAIYKVK